MRHLINQNDSVTTRKVRWSVVASAASTVVSYPISAYLIGYVDPDLLYTTFGEFRIAVELLLAAILNATAVFLVGYNMREELVE